MSLGGGRRTFEQPPYSVLRCRRCGLHYKSAIADNQTLSRYYSLTAFRKWESPDLYPSERPSFSCFERFRGGKILDFGCSSGRLLERLVGDYQCLGFEINVEAAAVAPSKGLRYYPTRCSQLHIHSTRSSWLMFSSIYPNPRKQ